MGVELAAIVKKFDGLRVLVVGDTMVDNYLSGNVDRISPEAPVPVIQIKEKQSRLGGAANVALNLHGLGASVQLCSICGSDPNGSWFLQLLTAEDLDTSHIFLDESRPTTVKTRIASSNHQMLRFDEESVHPITQELRNSITEDIEEIIHGGLDVIILQDYDKGLFDPVLIGNIIDLAKKNNVPIAADPKREHFLDFKGVDLFKPNLKEVDNALQLSTEAEDIEALKRASALIRKSLSNTINLITLSAHGIFIDDSHKVAIFPALKRDIADVSGAGDTVISVAALCLSLGVDSEQLALLSNLAGGIVCEKFGVSPINKEELMLEAEKLQHA